MPTENERELSLALARARGELERVRDQAKNKDRFFATMSHEIRTPMNAILGMAELLLAGNLDEKQAGYAADIKLAAESLLGIVNDVLDLSKLESGKLSLVDVDYDFERLLENVCSIAFFLAKEKKLDFVYQPSGEIPRYLLGDEIRLRQVLLNLLGNAVKFTRRGSVRLAVEVEDGGGTLHFAVSDTGVGIRKEDLPHLFESFKQLDPRVNRHVTGTGLGLSIARRLVTIMGGTILVDSVYGKGSAFHVRVPLAPGDPRLVAGDEDNALRTTFRRDARVLVVDDNAINLRVAAGLVRLHGIACDTASSGQEALVMARKTDYDLIFMDHMMPGIDGVETVRRLRARGGGSARAPVVALTANAVIGARESLLAAGMSDFLAKPVEKSKLQSILAKWMPRSGDAHADLRRTELPPTLRGDYAERPGGGVLELASAIPRLDVDAGLKRVSGQQNMYEEILHLASETLPSIVDSIAAAFADMDFARLAVETHGARGSMASIGALSLSAQAGELEKAARRGDGDSCRAGLPPFLEGMRELADKLQELFAMFSSPATVLYGDLTQLAARLHKLNLALSRKDEKNIQKTLKSVVARDFGADINSSLARLKELVEAGEYAAAGQCVERIVDELGE